MSETQIRRIPFAKIVLVLAITLGVSLGLCGLTFAFWSRAGSGARILIGLGMVELVAMALSAAGLVLTGVVWVTVAVVGSFQEKVSQPQKLFDEGDDTKLDKKE
jgi:uncharacterized membrane protein YqhA